MAQDPFGFEQNSIGNEKAAFLEDRLGCFSLDKIITGQKAYNDIGVNADHVSFSLRPS